MALSEDLDLTCPFCTRPLLLEVDLTAGASQRFTEDCEHCCRPIIISFRVDDGVVSELAVEQEY